MTYSKRRNKPDGKTSGKRGDWKVSQENENQETNTNQEAKETSEVETASVDNAEAEQEKEISEAVSEEDGSEVEDTSGVDETDAAAEEKAGDKKSLFGKKKSKLEEKVKELEDARMRQLAEFENFRKRSEKEKSQMFEVGAKSVIEKILPVIDNFERGFVGVTEEEKQAPFVAGMEMVYKQMLSALEEMGVKPIEAVGQPFDPNYHNAVMTVEDEALESGTVAEELQKGYLYQDSVVRHSMVKVVS
jgi:molecular chaperone GrpE